MSTLVVRLSFGLLQFYVNSVYVVPNRDLETQQIGLLKLYIYFVVKECLLRFSCSDCWSSTSVSKKTYGTCSLRFTYSHCFCSALIRKKIRLALYFTLGCPCCCYFTPGFWKLLQSFSVRPSHSHCFSSLLIREPFTLKWVYWAWIVTAFFDALVCGYKWEHLHFACTAETSERLREI